MDRRSFLKRAVGAGGVTVAMSEIALASTPRDAVPHRILSVMSDQDARADFVLRPEFQPTDLVLRLYGVPNGAWLGWIESADGKTTYAWVRDTGAIVLAD